MDWRTIHIHRYEMDIYDVLDFALKVLSAAVMATVAVWRIIRKYVEQQVQSECHDRKLADNRIEEKLRSNNETIHVQMGKIELMDQRIQEHERKRMEEVYELRADLRNGLHRIELQLERIKHADSTTKEKGD